MRTITTVPFAPLANGTPRQLIVKHKDDCGVIGGPALLLQAQTLFRGEWYDSSDGLELKPEDIGPLFEGLIRGAAKTGLDLGIAEYLAGGLLTEEQAGPLCGDPSRLNEDLAADDGTEEPSGDGQPSAFWESVQRAGPLTTSALASGESPGRERKARMARLLGGSEPDNTLPDVNLAEEHFAAFARDEDDEPEKHK